MVLNKTIALPAGMKNVINSVIRFWKGLNRPSKATSLRRLKERGETLDSFTIREATAADVPALAALHVKTWMETYPGVRQPPTFYVREYQWREQFNSPDKNWFCYIVVNGQGQLVGFAKGLHYNHSDLPMFSGEVNKIYLLRQYHRLGLGKKLLCAVVNRFLSEDINSMVLFGIPQNPSGYFHEAMGAKKLLNKKGGFDGGYGWYDLQQLTHLCSAT
jgi:L-amino acid N-acyltransferase YncA